MHKAMKVIMIFVALYKTFDLILDFMTKIFGIKPCIITLSPIGKKIMRGGIAYEI